MSRVIRYDRGERVKVSTDAYPQPFYIVLAIDENGARLAQLGTGFTRTVPVEELKPELAS